MPIGNYTWAEYPVTEQFYPIDIGNLVGCCCSSNGFICYLITSSELILFWYDYQNNELYKKFFIFIRNIFNYK